LTPDQIDQVLDLIETLSARGQPFIPQSGRLSRQPTRQDVPAGRRLFIGRARLSRGGPACINCHHVAGVGYLGGGRLGADLTNVALKYKDVELASILKAPGFPLMSRVYGDRELTDEEVVKVFAFLRSVRRRTSDTVEADSAYLVGAAVGVVALFGLTGLVWRGRLRGVRRNLLRKPR